MRWRLLPLGVAAVLAVVATTAEARPFDYAFKSKYAEFDFSWSSEAAAVPPLVKRLRAELAKEKAKTISGGKEEFALRQKMGSEGIGWTSSTKITTSGQTARLLSLSRAYWAFTGGAHGNGATSALLWDRVLGREIKFDALFRPNSGYITGLRGPFCRGLDAERAKRRGGERLGGEFDQCPPFSDLALIPIDTNRNGRFDHLLVVAAPYVAGPYAEGEYEVRLPIGVAHTAKMKPEYRSSFGR